jgi:tetratricopeptide (TPR) repeat protein
LNLGSVERRLSIWIVLTICGAIFYGPALACGPSFPNSMLDRGDEAVLAAPTVNFFTDLERLPLPRSKFHAHNVADYAAEAAEADAKDLREALGKLPGTKPEQIAAYEFQRARLTAFREALQQWSQNDATPPAPRPVMENVNAPSISEIPAEFVEYLQGSTAWFNGQTNRAREFWQAVLRHPPEERHFRSTWAAYMLGKLLATEDPEGAIACFQQVRSLKLAGFSDRLGLAAASLGEEARVRLRQTNASVAIDLYLQQLAAGEGSAVSSLRYACREALTNSDDTLAGLAANPLPRRVMSSYLASDRAQYDDDENLATNRLRWLDAVESANVKDMDCAEELALAAYQAGEWETTQRWINRAPSTPTAQWLQAKLLLRAAKIEDAASLLHRLVDLFPAGDNATNEAKPTSLQDTLEMNGSTYTADFVSLQSQTLAESGALHLTHREYAQALDALLRSGFWMDAAYVAERVLTADELKTYVDQNWPAPIPPTTNSSEEFRVNIKKDIRYLLGRRLARAGQWGVARAYYPQAQLANYDAMVNSLAYAADSNSSARQRLDGLLNASSLIRFQGMELLGCEVEPDWALSPDYGGNFELTIVKRGETNAQIVRATADEMDRAQRGVDPSRRFHYRYDAASLALVAARLMPDNSDGKAIVLCTAGSWLKARDPQFADVFYKTLVRHCRKTAIGTLADRMRWFPELDAQGHPVPWQPPPPVETDGAGDGFWYSLNRGNTLQDVADTVQQQHQVTTSLAEMKEANPGINMNRLKAGLKIFVPKPAPPEEINVSQ